MTPSVVLPLRNAVYRRLFAAQVIALLGTGLTTVALGLLAFEMAGGKAGEVLGIALALKMASYVVVSPLVAALASKVPRKRLLVSLDVVRALSVVSIIFVDQIWQIYALIVVLSSASAGFTPAFQALIPDIFEDPDTYTEALSLSRLAYELESLLSPVVAAALLTFVAFSGLFALNAAAFACSAFLVMASAIPGVASRPLSSRRLTQVAAGIKQFFSVPRLRGLVALNLAAAAASAMILVNSVVLVKDQFGLGDTEVALALGAAGGGSMIVALALPWMLRRRTDRTLMISGSFILCVALLGSSQIHSMFGLIACWLAMGVGLGLVQTPTGRLLQRSGTAGERPALFAAQFSLSHFCWLITYPIAGFVGASFGVDVAAVVLTSLAVFATVLAGFVWRPGNAPSLRVESNA